MVDQEFILEANITNEKESAYEAKLFVFHPTALSYINLKTEKDKHVRTLFTFHVNPQNCTNEILF